MTTIPITINNRPFASDYITGLMLPDGIFEASIGRLQLNAHFTNSGSVSQSNLRMYVESASHPGIRIIPATQYVSHLAGGASTLQHWEVDISAAPPGKHYVSFIAENATGRARIIKRIFITKVNFNATDKTFSIECPEGKMVVAINEVFESKPEYDNCDCKKSRQKNGKYSKDSKNVFDDALRAIKKLEINDLKDCPPQTVLIKSLSVGVSYTPGFTGQYGELPFEDPWWKTLLVVLAIILLIAAIVVAAVYGAPFIAAGAGAVIVGGAISCCTVPFFVAIGLTVGSAGSAILAGAADIRDPFRRGQDNTLPGAGETTVAESLDIEFNYIEPIALGKPYAIGTKWKYNRTTTDTSSIERNYPYDVEEVNNNIHVLSRYTVDAPDVVRVYEQREKPFIVKASFYDKDEKRLRGDQLFVKCFLQRKTDNQIISFLLDDNGNMPDNKPNDGVYTGTYHFSSHEDGLWKMYVIAQDVNHANENMTPDEAAQIIGGQILTQQLTIEYSGGTCPLVPDGDVHVMG